MCALTMCLLQCFFWPKFFPQMRQLNGWSLKGSSRQLLSTIFPEDKQGFYSSFRMNMFKTRHSMSNFSSFIDTMDSLLAQKSFSISHPLIDIVTSSEMGLQWSCILEGLVANMTQHFLVFTVYSPNVSPTGDFLWKRATTQTAAEVLSNNLDLVFHI